MNPNDNNNLNINQNQVPVNNNQDTNTNEDTGVSSIASKEEIPMSIEKVEESKSPQPTPVNNIFTQDLNVVSSNVNENKPIDIKPIENQDKDQSALYNYQTNAINPNASVNLNDFRIDEDFKAEKKENSSNIPELTNTSVSSETPLPEINNLESTVTSTPSPVETEQTQPMQNTTDTINQPASVPSPSSSNTILIAVLGVIFAAGLITGGYFVFFRNSKPSETSTVATEEFKTEKIVVKNTSDTKVLSDEEYKTTIKSFIDRYNNNIRNFKVNQATPNLTLEQKLEIYMSYSTEVLNIYTDIQNLKVPQTYRDSHDKLTLSLYALNALFDNLIIQAKDMTLTAQSENQILENIIKAETVAASAFNEIVGAN